MSVIVFNPTELESCIRCKETLRFYVHHSIVSLTLFYPPIRLARSGCSQQKRTAERLLFLPWLNAEAESKI